MSKYKFVIYYENILGHKQINNSAIVNKTSYGNNANQNVWEISRMFLLLYDSFEYDAHAINTLMLFYRFWPILWETQVTITSGYTSDGSDRTLVCLKKIVIRYVFWFIFLKAISKKTCQRTWYFIFVSNTFKYRWLFNKGDRMGRCDYI